MHETGPAGYPFAVVQGNLRREVRSRHARQEHGPRDDRRLDHARRREEDPGDGRPGFRRAEEAGAHARVQAGAARPQGVDRGQEHAAHDSTRRTSSPSSKAATRSSRTNTSSTRRTGITSGVGAPVNGDKIYNGALDNASGVATVLEIARAFTQVQPQPKRSILFLMVTAEEQGLLGSQYYSITPLYPLDKTSRTSTSTASTSGAAPRTSPSSAWARRISTTT